MSSARSTSAALAVLAVVATGGGPADADRFRDAGRLTTLGLGWESAAHVSVGGQLGLAGGPMVDALGLAAAVHIALGARLRLPSDDGVDVNGSLTVGHTWRAGIYLGLEAGVDARLHPDLLTGPIARAHFGVGTVGLYGYLAALFGDDDQIVGGLGIELYRLR